VSKRIAPVLDSLVKRRDPAFAVYHPQAEVEYRALLAVATAAQGVADRYLKVWHRKANRKEDVLVRALARLARAGSGKHGTGGATP
jgi:hypothetical protein